MPKIDIQRDMPKLADALLAAGFIYDKFPKGFRSGSKEKYFYQYETPDNPEADAGPKQANFRKGRFFIGYDGSGAEEFCLIRAIKKGEDAALLTLAQYLRDNECSKAFDAAWKNPNTENLAELNNVLLHRLG